MDPQKLQCETSGGAKNPVTEYRINEAACRIRDLPESLRPREELARQGIENVSDEVLLALVLRSGVRGTNVVSMARKLLIGYGSLTGLASVSVSELSGMEGMGPVKAGVLKAALELGRRLNRETAEERVRIRCPADAARLLQADVRTLDTEVFWVLHLDTKNQLRGKPLKVTQGLIDSSPVDARAVFREAVRSASAAMVMAHNHPSGDPTPSVEDIRITRQLVEAGKIVGIRVLDHVVLAGGLQGERPFVSLRESGIVDFA